MSPFLKTAIEVGTHESYYALCDAHPLRSGTPKIGVSAKNVMAATSGLIQLEKLSGPGSVYKLLALPEGVGLNFIIQGREIVETHFRINTAGIAEEGSFVVLSKDLLQVSGCENRTPPYPRPAFYSMDEFVDILQGFDLMIRKLERSIR
jgi:hypothetical protein